MKVLSLYTDNGASKFYRMSEPARVLNALGVDVTVADGLDVEAELNSATKLVEVKEIKEDVDLIIIQRPLDNAYTSLIKQAKRQGIATIVELDDDLHTVHALNVAAHPLGDMGHSGPNWITSACIAADHVSVSTPALLKNAPHKRATVLRNNVPSSIFSTPKPKRYNEGLALGWSGSVATHPTDLQQTKGTVAEFLKSPALQLNVVGDGVNVRKNLGLREDYPLNATGWVDFIDYYKTMRTFIDIGIIPLELSTFNNAKSDLKGIEMGALGIPFVASPTPEYLRLEAYGIGKTAKSPGDWRRHLRNLIDNPSSLERAATSYRDRIEETRTYEHNAHQWLDAWEQAIDYRKKHNE